MSQTFSNCIVFRLCETSSRWDLSKTFRVKTFQNASSLGLFKVFSKRFALNFFQIVLRSDLFKSNLMHKKNKVRSFRDNFSFHEARTLSRLRFIKGIYKRRGLMAFKIVFFFNPLFYGLISYQKNTQAKKITHLYHFQIISS